jgi:hypothetical protein
MSLIFDDCRLIYYKKRKNLYIETNLSFDPIYPHSLLHLPPERKISTMDFGDLLIKARVALAELKGACGQLLNPLLLMAPTEIHESVAR